jgi:hypothetical protein
VCCDDWKELRNIIQGTKEGKNERQAHSLIVVSLSITCIYLSNEFYNATLLRFKFGFVFENYHT